MTLRPAILEDAPALARLGRESFIDAFGHLYRAQDLSAFLAEVHDEGVVAGEIAGAECRHALAVDDGGALLGYCKLRHPSKLARYSDAGNHSNLASSIAPPPLPGAASGLR